MDREKNEKRKTGLNRGLLVVICAMIAAMSFFGAIIILLTQGAESTLMIGLGAVFVGSVGVLCSLILSMQKKRERQGAEEYEEIYKAQKASYLVLKRNFEELSDILYDMEENGSLPTDEIIDAQKAIAKVTISRSKENTDALMRSNDTLINQIFGFEEKLESNNADLKGHNEQILEKLRQELSTQNTDISRRIDSVTDAVKNMQHSISSLEKNQAALGTQPVMMAVQAMQPMQGGYAMPQAAMQPMASQPMMSTPQPAAEPVLEPVMEAPAAPEPMPVVEEPVAETIPEPAIEEAATPAPEPAVEPAAPEPEPAPAPEPVAEPVAPVEEPAPEPVAEVTPPSDDPNKQLSPDEIAAMFAQTEAAPEPEPEPVEDPNKQLSPEEIAAMFAQAGGAPEPEPEPEITPPSDDPNKVLSPEEIAAMFAGA